MSEYATTSDGGRTVLIHRQLWEQNHSKIPEGMIIHHKNFNKKDNRIENLELLSRSEHGKVHQKQKELTNNYKKLTLLTE
jgi:hypothetical protein